MRNAIQHGKEIGDWGYWLVRNKDNDEAIFALLTAIGGPDWRPRWRAAYCLEAMCGRNVKGIFEKLPDMPDEVKERIKTVFDVITLTGVEDHLKTTTDDEGKRKKPQLVLEEIEMFNDYINEYRKRKQQRQIIKSLTST